MNRIFMPKDPAGIGYYIPCIHARDPRRVIVVKASMAKEPLGICLDSRALDNRKGGICYQFRLISHMG